MSTQKSASKRKTVRSLPRDERGDPSQRALKATIVVCLVGLVAVYLFAFTPRKAASPATSSTTARPPQTKEAVASFDRQSLSTKNR